MQLKLCWAALTLLFIECSRCQCPGARTTRRPRCHDGINTQISSSTWSCPDSQLANTTKVIRFFGTSYLHYHFANLSPDGLQLSDYEELIFSFTTSNPDGLIWLSQFGDRTLHLSMKSGYMMFVLSEGRISPQIIYIRPQHQRGLHDWHWHKFLLIRNRTKVDFFVDDEKVVSDNIRSNVQLVTPGEVYLGGTPDTSQLTNWLVLKNFEGALVDVRYSKTSRQNYNVKICLIEFLHHAQIHGQVDIVSWREWYHTSHTERTTQRPWTPTSPPTLPSTTSRLPTTNLLYPITFITRESLIVIGSLDLRIGGIITFRFKTTEPRGILLFNRGRKTDANFMAVEIFDGKLYFIFDFGSVTRRIQFANIQVDNGLWNEVIIDFSQRNIHLSLNQRHRQDIRHSFRPDLYFVSGYIGGVTYSTILPWYVWSRHGFQGCIEDLKFKNIKIDIHDALQRAFLQGVHRGCNSLSWQCSSHPCERGSCHNHMDRYYCDCSNTSYTGKMCHEDAVIAGMDGNHFAQLNFLERHITHTNDISFRFLTLSSNGLLFQTVCDGNDNFIRAELEDGRIKVTVYLNGERKIIYAGQHLNDYHWHTLYIRRRASNVEIWVDDGEHSTGALSIKDFYIEVDRIYAGSVFGVGIQNYIGYMQNFWFDNVDVFESFRSKPDSDYSFLLFITDIGNLPLLTYHPVTITTSMAHVQLSTLQISLTMRLFFKFRTRKLNGVILFNQGRHSKCVAVELSNGLLRYILDTGGDLQSIVVHTPEKLNDNEWHTVWIRQISNHLHEVRVDNTAITVSTNGRDDAFNLDRPLFIGGLPDKMFSQHFIKKHLHSREGFVGCLASFNLNGAFPKLLEQSAGNPYIVDGCKYILCQPGLCANEGVCIPTVVGHWCDCNMTSRVGVSCTEEATGLYFGKYNKDGIIVYTFPNELQKTSYEDRIAFGFMTREENGFLMKIDSGSEFIEIGLELGHVIVHFDTGKGLQKLIVDNFEYNDGNYHIVKFIRTSSRSILTVDNIYNTHKGSHSVLNAVYRVMIGANQDSGGAMINTFNGIIAGFCWNGLRILDLAERRYRLIEWTGSVTIAFHPFKLVDIVVTAKPTLTPLPPVGGTLMPTIAGTPFPAIDGTPFPTGSIHAIQPDIGGEGNIGGPGSFGGKSGGQAVIGGGPGGGGLVVPPEGPAVAALTGAAGAPPTPVTGARAGAVLGSILGTMAFLSGLMWAFYKCKPGWCTYLQPGATPVQASRPHAATNLSAIQAAAGGHYGTREAGGAGVGGSAFSSYYQSSAMSAQAGAGGIDGGHAGGAGAGGGGSAMSVQSGASGAGTGRAKAYDSATLRATGTFSNKGTVLGTPKSARVHLGAGGNGSKMASYSYESNSYSHTAPDYDQTGSMGLANYQANAHSSGAATSKYSASTLSSYNYQVQNMRSVTMNHSGQQMIGYAGTSSAALTPGAAADEVRVDCCLITADGNSVVTGSSLGPPQVWDMHTGELLRTMKGDTVGSSSLHLTGGDRLLVGAVHSDLEFNKYSSRKGVFNHKLQIWDFVSGKPLEMDQQEYCSALCTMSDPDKVIFGRSTTYGNATSIVVWNLMGNQPIKEIQYDTPVGNNDYINFLSVSKNDCHVIAGFTNSIDNFAEFVVFDMNLTSCNIKEPCLLRLDANPECTVLLPQDEAITGLHTGELVVWSLRTGLPSRQLLMSNGAHAHSSEIKAVTLSENGKYLVSASADGSLKVWDMQNERLQTVLTGHNDEVWCCAISPDNEIVVSGSRDGTIRMWQSRNGQEICLFKTGVDVFFVTVSHDKSTIVALGDKFRVQKLIMLQVIRTKIRRQLSA